MRSAAFAAALLAAGAAFADGPKLRSTDPLQPFWYSFRQAVLKDKYADLKEHTRFPFETINPEGELIARLNKRQFDIDFPNLTAVAVGKRSMLELIESRERLAPEDWEDAADGDLQIGSFIFQRVKGRWYFTQAIIGAVAAKPRAPRPAEPTTAAAESGAPDSYDHSQLTSPNAPSILARPSAPAARPRPEPVEDEPPEPPPPPKPKKVKAPKRAATPPKSEQETAVEAPVTPMERPAAPGEDVGGTTSPKAKSVLGKPAGKAGQTTVKTIKAPPAPKEPPGGIEPEAPDLPAAPAEDLSHFRGYWYAFRGAVLANNDEKIKSLTKFSFETKGDTDAARVKKHNAQEFTLLWGRLLQADPQTGPLRDSMREFIFRRVDLTVEELAGESKGEVRVGLFIFKKLKGKWTFVRAMVED